MFHDFLEKKNVNKTVEPLVDAKSLTKIKLVAYYPKKVAEPTGYKIDVLSENLCIDEGREMLIL